MATTKEILDEVGEARRGGVAYFACGGNAFDPENSVNDWVACIVAYAGQAASRGSCGDGWEAPYRFRGLMVKVAALAVAAIESADKIAGRRDGDKS